MCAPNPRTPGMERRSRLARSTIRTTSWWPVPGRVTQSARKSRSLNVGKSDSPRNGVTARPATSVTTVAPTTRIGVRTTRAERGGVPPLEQAHERRLLLVERRLPEEQDGPSAGVTVSATAIEASTARPYEGTSGRKNAPETLVMKKTGMTASHDDERRVDDRPAHLERRVEHHRHDGRGASDVRCCRSRRTMFSMSMIASSTTTPTEITNPASTIVLIVAPVA